MAAWKISWELTGNPTLPTGRFQVSRLLAPFRVLSGWRIKQPNLWKLWFFTTLERGTNIYEETDHGFRVISFNDIWSFGSNRGWCVKEFTLKNLEEDEFTIAITPCMVWHHLRLAGWTHLAKIKSYMHGTFCWRLHVWGAQIWSQITSQPPKISLPHFGDHILPTKIWVFPKIGVGPPNHPF